MQKPQIPLNLAALFKNSWTNSYPDSSHYSCVTSPGVTAYFIGSRWQAVPMLCTEMTQSSAAATTTGPRSIQEKPKEQQSGFATRLLNYKASRQLGAQAEWACKGHRHTLCHRKNKREEIKLLRLPSLLDGIVVVEVVESDGICRMPVWWTPRWELFFLLACPPSWHRKFCFWDVASYRLHINNYKLIFWRSLKREFKRRK